jgi:hypothetical protein
LLCSIKPPGEKVTGMERRQLSWQRGFLLLESWANTCHAGCRTNSIMIA